MRRFSRWLPVIAAVWCIVVVVYSYVLHTASITDLSSKNIIRLLLSVSASIIIYKFGILPNKNRSDVHDVPGTRAANASPKQGRNIFRAAYRERPVLTVAFLLFLVLLPFIVELLTRPAGIFRTADWLSVLIGEALVAGIFLFAWHRPK